MLLPNATEMKCKCSGDNNYSNKSYEELYLKIILGKCMHNYYALTLDSPFPYSKITYSRI